MSNDSSDNYTGMGHKPDCPAKRGYPCHCIVKLTEEVPGVPESERWFAWTGVYPVPEDQHFRTLEDGEAWCRARNLSYTVERFEL